LPLHARIVLRRAPPARRRSPALSQRYPPQVESLADARGTADWQRPQMPKGDMGSEGGKRCSIPDGDYAAPVAFGTRQCAFCGRLPSRSL